MSRRLFAASARAMRRVVAVWLLAAVAAGSVLVSPAVAQAQPPAAPTGLAATSQANDTANQIVLSWTDPSDSSITKYQVRTRADDASSWSSWADISGSSATTTSHTVTGLTTRKRYTVELRAVNANGNGAAASVTWGAHAVLVNNTGQGAHSTGVDINTDDGAQAFTTGSNVGGYILSSVVLVMLIDSADVVPTYNVYICDDSNSAPGSTCSSALSKPTLANGVNWFTSAAGVNLKSDTTYWVVFDSVSGGFSQIHFRETPSDGEDSGGLSDWSIANTRANRSRGGGSWTTTNTNALGIAVFGFGKTGPSAPTGLSAAPGSSQLSLSWTDPSNAGINKYQVRVSADGGTSWSPDWTDIAGSGATTTSHAVTGLQNGTTYTVELRAVGDGGDTPGASARTMQTPAVSETPPDSGSGGGSAPVGPVRPVRPVPSVVDFELDVGRGIRSLHADNAAASGVWSDGESLWLLDDAAGRVFVYGLAGGQRRAGLEFELDASNASPVGLSSDGETLWVLDSAANKLFAYSLADGGRLPAHDVALEDRFGSPRAVWSGGGSHYVVSNPLAVYDRAAGALVGSWELDSLNRRPAGAWSDGTTLWVSDSRRSKVFAYRLPRPDGAEPGGSGPSGEAGRLMRVRGEEFNLLPVVGNSSPAGLWSDGGTMYVADRDDSRVYAYNMPDSIDTRLASLSLTGVDIGEFSPPVAGYSGAAAAGVRLTTVKAEAAQSGAEVVIEPADADSRGRGHQARVFDGAEVAVTVTASDGSRSRVYRVQISAPPQGYFIDDDGSVHAADIDAAAAAGIAAGCNPPEDDRFCPDQAVTRAQMATFLVRALDLAPAPRPARFTDIDPQGVHAADIDAVVAAGIAAGCNPPEDDRFCPDQAVTRAQMATFLVRALDLAPAPRPARFTDIDPQGVHAADIDALHAAGITGGCLARPLRYCGDQPVTRAQMATFLTRALDLPNP